MSILTNLAETHSKDLRMLVFSSLEERMENEQIIKEDRGLKDFTYIVSSAFPIVHTKEVSLLRKKGLKFQALKPVTTDGSKPVTKDDLTSQQIEGLKQKKMFFVQVCGLLFLVKGSPPEWRNS